MAGSSFGDFIRLTSFGESHGIAIGGVIDGFPSNIEIDLETIQHQLNRRKPGQSAITTQRKEDDEVEFLSGIFEGKTTGTPIGFIIRNNNAKSKDYSHLKNNFRPSHADFTYTKKYGIYDYRGGGRASARETAIRVVAGALCEQYLASKGIQITAFVDQIGTIKTEKTTTQKEIVDQTIVRCPDKAIAEEMETFIKAIRKEGSTVGGSVKCIITGVPIGLGEPVYDKLEAQLAKAMLSINAVKGFEIGSGFAGITMKGSEHNDIFNPDGSTKTNFSGGIQGGISNGMPIEFRVAFKPVATIMQPQKSINSDHQTILLEGKGRHDPCVVPRAVPIVEAMVAITLCDSYLKWKAYQNS